LQLSFFENLLWQLGAALKVLLCGLAFYRGLYQRLPLFTVYASLLLAEAVVVRWVYHQWGYTSLAAWYVYWTALGVVLAARGLVVAELCWTSLRNYPAIWSFARRLLSVTALVVLTYAGIAAARNASPMVAFLLTTERGLELSVAVILVALLGIGVRYKVWLEPIERNVALGLALYSTFQMVNNTFMNQWMSAYFHWWGSTRVASFEIAMVIWIISLLKPCHRFHCHRR